MKKLFVAKSEEINGGVYEEEDGHWQSIKAR